MVAERRHVDLEDNPDFAKVVNLVRTSHEPVDVHKDGRLVAIVSPSVAAEEPAVSGDDLKNAFLATAGSMKDIIPEDFVEEIHRLRNRPSQRRVPTF